MKIMQDPETNHEAEKGKQPNGIGKFPAFLFFISTVFFSWLIIVPFAKAKKIGRGLLVYLILVMNTLTFGNLTPAPGTYEGENDLLATIGSLIGSGGISSGITASGKMVGTVVPIIVYFFSWLYLLKIYEQKSKVKNDNEV